MCMCDYFLLLTSVSHSLSRGAIRVRSSSTTYYLPPSYSTILVIPSLHLGMVGTPSTLLPPTPPLHCPLPHSCLPKLCCCHCGIPSSGKWHEIRRYLLGRGCVTNDQYLAPDKQYLLPRTYAASKKEDLEDWTSITPL